ncbi:uncharacterized protein LOC118462868 [Anopheles albimanus]|uniref:uncharacterized protein LOC118462868 n=1 Tax=Anopheles albimanus TaxID=7167 RepID=UPI00164097EA|nr:uncharacterized protein LOC118462868 [Anopheles albimanus]
MNVLRLSLTVALLLTLLHCAIAGASDRTSLESTDPNDSKGDPCECRCPGGECCGEEEKAGRKKREEGTSTTVSPKEIVAQPGFVRPARRRKLCIGRRTDFTEDCGPRPRAYKTRNFVMKPAPAPAAVTV